MRDRKLFTCIFLLTLLLCAIAYSQTDDIAEADRLYRMGRSLAFERRYLEATDSLKGAFSLDPSNRRVILLLGDIYLKMGNLPGAEQAYSQLLQLDLKKPNGYIKLAELYWHWEQYNIAMEYLRTASQLTDPDDPEVYFWKGQLMRSVQNLPASDSIMQEGLKYYPDYPRLLANNASTRILLGDSITARKYLDSAYHLDSNSLYVVNTMVSYQIYKDNLEKAGYYLQRASSIDPDDPFTRSNMSTYKNALRGSLAIKYFQEGNQAFGKAFYRKARDSYLNALAEDSLFFEAVMNLGFCYMHLGEQENAANAFSRAAGLRPDYARAYVGWGDALVGLYRLDEALVKYSKALELDPDNKELQDIYNQVLEAKQEMDLR